MSRWLRIAALILVVAVSYLQWSSHSAIPGAGSPATVARSQSLPLEQLSGPDAFLPPEAVATLERIKRGGPFPYERDGVVFQNREARLPQQPHGYYHEYTVDTPGARDRGARRIIVGGSPPAVAYYTDNHYASFRRVELPQ